MKKIFFSAMPLASLAFLILQSADPLPIGAPLPSPELKMMDVSGKQVSFKEATKKSGLMVMFSCNTCPVVKRYQSRTVEICGLAAKNDIGVILLNSNEASRDDGDSFGDMKEYAEDQGYDFNYVLDKNSTMADAFGASRTPEIFLFDKNGKLAYHGAIDDNPSGQVTRKHASIAIGEMVTGKDISVKQTKSVGCGIRRI